MKPALLAVCAAAMAVAGLANAQERTIADSVRDMVADRSDEGETLVGEILIGEIAEGDSLDYTFRIDPSKKYWVYGACDDDCSDIDMIVSDAAGLEVDDDIEIDDAPILLIAPGSAGDRITVTIGMATCETDVCVTGVGLYEAAASEGQQASIGDYVRDLVAGAADPGETLVGDILTGEIGSGDSLRYAFRIDPKKTYWVYGACDNDCTDIDLTAMDATGKTVAQDVEEDDGPILLIEPGSAGDRLTVSIGMAGCDTEVCVTGVGLYEVASGEEERTINDYVRGLVEAMSDSGEERVGEIMMGEIGEDQSLEYTFSIDPQATYWVYGACDEDCSDIDLAASDGSGRMVDEDIGPDDAPVLLIKPGSAGRRLAVSITMASCETEVCVTGVGLYQEAP